MKTTCKFIFREPYRPLVAAIKPHYKYPLSLRVSQKELSICFMPYGNVQMYEHDNAQYGKLT